MRMRVGRKFQLALDDTPCATKEVMLAVFLMVMLVISLDAVTCAASDSNLLNAVTDFGADPTGLKDSTKQLQALFDQTPNGWQGFIPLGTYLVSSGLVISGKTAIRIVGAAGGSFGSPVLSWTGAAGGTVITLQGTSYSSLGAFVHFGVQQCIKWIRAYRDLCRYRYKSIFTRSLRRHPMPRPVDRWLPFWRNHCSRRRPPRFYHRQCTLRWRRRRCLSVFERSHGFQSNCFW